MLVTTCDSDSACVLSNRAQIIGEQTLSETPSYLTCLLHTIAVFNFYPHIVVLCGILHAWPYGKFITKHG